MMESNFNCLVTTKNHSAPNRHDDIAVLVRAYLTDSKDNEKELKGGEKHETGRVESEIWPDSDDENEQSTQNKGSNESVEEDLQEESWSWARWLAAEHVDGRVNGSDDDCSSLFGDACGEDDEFGDECGESDNEFGAGFGEEGSDEGGQALEKEAGSGGEQMNQGPRRSIGDDSFEDDYNMEELDVIDRVTTH
ncbi:hypothetical protein FRC05_007124 [Tulasnella sp. 425]|nr:hypothetical protein FRC05_007124 [Tulasnella sp. 425]